MRLNDDTIAAALSAGEAVTLQTGLEVKICGPLRQSGKDMPDDVERKNEQTANTIPEVAHILKSLNINAGVEVAYNRLIGDLERF